METNNQPDQSNQKPKPTDNTANWCGIIALVLIGTLGLYYIQVLTGVVVPPPGLFALWVMAILLCSTAKISDWAVERRMRKIEARHAAIETRHAADIAEVRECVKALRELTATLLNDGDEAARQAVERARTLINESTDGVSPVSLVRTRPGS